MIDPLHRRYSFPELHTCSKTELQKRYQEVQEQIAALAERSNATDDEVTVLAWRQVHTWQALHPCSSYTLKHAKSSIRRILQQPLAVGAFVRMSTITLSSAHALETYPTELRITLHNSLVAIELDPDETYRLYSVLRALFEV